MTQVQTVLKETGVIVKIPTFLAQVERLATTIDDFLIPSLRLEIHPDSWSPQDFLQEIPETQGVDLPKEAIARIVEQYLHEANPAEEVTGVRLDKFSYTQNSLEQNVSFFQHTADCWRDRHYSKKNNIDRLIDSLKARIGKTARQGAEQIAQRFGLTKYLPQPSLNGTLAHSMAQYTEELYRQTGVQGEEPVRLYQLCFQALAQAKGWDKLEDKDLLKVLDAEGIPVKEFTELTGREIEIPSKNPSEKDAQHETYKADTQSRSSISLILDSAPAENGEFKTQNDWIAYWNNIRDGRRFASLADYYQVFRQLDNALRTGSSAERTAANQSIVSLRKDLREKWLLTSTRIIYQPNSLEARLIHGFGAGNPHQTSERNLTVPLCWDTPITEVYSTAEGLAYLRSLLSTDETGPVIAERLSAVSGYQPQNIKIWTPALQVNGYLTRSQLPERAVWLGAGDRRFRLSACGHPAGSHSRSRGVRP
ncbi:MAG TPA: hypothetical protein VJG31_03575 [Candidatus Nanoarchaeia archaeon]|nr:hypothetical protein [Candidatus Nanoarchaeia archaeon]